MLRELGRVGELPGVRAALLREGDDADEGMFRNCILDPVEVCRVRLYGSKEVEEAVPAHTAVE